MTSTPFGSLHVEINKLHFAVFCVFCFYYLTERYITKRQELCLIFYTVFCRMCETDLTVFLIHG